MMTLSDRFSNESAPAAQALANETPAGDVVSLQDLAEKAAAGRRGAAWQLLHRIKENDSHTIAAIDALDEDRLTHHLLEWIALGTWAGKPFVAPASLRSPAARMHLHTYFRPRESVDPLRVERMLITVLQDDQPALRLTTANILGMLGGATAVPYLIEALHDPVQSVQCQAVKALGHMKSQAAVPDLLSLLPHADEQLGSQVFTALAQIGSAAVPALIELSKDESTWLRWHSIHALGETNDLRALPVLVQALADKNQSVAWAAAKGLTPFGRLSVGPILRLLMFVEVTPWLAETASYVLSNHRGSRFGPYIEPVLQEMHGFSFRIGTMLAAQKALAQLVADGLEQEYALEK